MCGIFCLLLPSHVNPESLLNDYKQFAPLILQRGPNFSNTEIHESSTRNILFSSSVLWLQGTKLTPQPLISETAILMYNGDLFGKEEVRDLMKSGMSDTTVLFNLLEDHNNVINILSQVEGPYAFIYLNKITNQLYFARDPFGRRSLLIGKSNDKFIISSVAKNNSGYTFVEVPCCGVFCLDLNTFNFHLFPWKTKINHFSNKILEIEMFLEKPVNVETVKFVEPIIFIQPSATFLEQLNYLATLPHNTILDYLLKDPHYSTNVEELKHLLVNSIKKRLQAQPKFCQNCFKNYDCQHAITGVLFSGGVDCAILALLTDECVDQLRPIDLINVAFEKGGSFEAPDRVTGTQTFKELKSLRPHRKWNFVEIDVSKEELDFYRTSRISDLIYPLQSILDDSLGCALWFASRGSSRDYNTPCRTLLVGMGADEIFGGYTRHRAALQKKSWEGLHDVLVEDWYNLPHRNLGRDDRVVSDHGRQLRTPYLDEEVVQFVRSLNCWERTLPVKNLPQGIGEKILLRCLAYDLGLKNAATLKKRALQFGSRIANSKEKGHEKSERL